MNFKRLRRSDELENVAVFKQSDSYADGSERAGGAEKHVSRQEERTGSPFTALRPSAEHSFTVYISW